MKKFIGLVVVLCILLCTLAVAANEPPHNISWTINDGILTITGTGAMEDYKTEDSAPWHANRSDITEIVVEEGITHIGNLAFYGLKNAKTAQIANSVESIGLCAFDYTEGTRTTLGNPTAPFQATLESDRSCVKKGESFTLTVKVKGDFKDVSAFQTAIIFEKSKVAFDEKQHFDSEWLKTVGDVDFGYISEPLSGIVANNLRIAYVSLSGETIDEESPLYAKGETEVVAAKAVCTAIEDIKDINTGVFMLKNSVITTVKNKAVVSQSVGENQLTTCTRLPIPELVIKTGSPAAVTYAKDNGLAVESTNETNKEATKEVITITSPYGEIATDVVPYVSEDGCLMLPLRAIMEKMGVAVIWDNETKTVFMSTADDFAAHQLGKTVLFTNTESVNLEHSSEAKDGRLLVTPDFYKKSFGIEIEYNNENNTATVK